MPVEISEIKELLKELVLSQKETDIKFKESDIKWRESREELDQRFKESREELDQRFKETESQFKKTDKRIQQAFDLFEGQWGKLMESLVEGDVLRILQERNIKVTDTSMRRKGHHEGQNYEFDIIAHNGNEIVIVEVKTTLRVDDVKQFLEKLTKAKGWMAEYKNHTIYGAVAYLKAEGGSEIFAQNKNLFVIRATGKSARIINEPNFQPAKY